MCPTPRLMLLLGIVIGILVAVILANFVSSEKHLRHRIKPEYAVGDPQFVRTMNALLGYLTENCCGGASGLCAPAACAPTKSEREKETTP